MRRSLFFMSTIAIFLCAATIWGATWYVDGWDGSDTHYGTNMSTDAFKTLKRALNRCNNGDTIALKGEFLETPRDTTYSGSGGWDSTVRAQIFVDKSNITMIRNTGEPFIPVIYGYSPDDSLQYVMRIDNAGNTIEDIKFDGYDSWQWNGDVCTMNNIYMTPDADYTEISYCEFTNFGNEWSVGQEPYYFYSIVSGGYSGHTNMLSNVKINDNDFYDNPFETQCAHEIYLTYTENSEIKRNDITNNGEGDPIKLRDICNSITIDNNTIQGAHFGFIEDCPETDKGEDSSTNIIVTDNTFSDPYSVIDDNYLGPFYSSNNHYPFISEFWGNTISYLFSESNLVKTYGVTCDADSAYLAVYRLDEGKTSLYKFRKQGGPIKHFLGSRAKSGYYAQGDMCTTSASVIISAFDTSSDSCKVYKFDKSSTASSSVEAPRVYSGRTSNGVTVTALAPKTSSTFVTALVESGDAKIYESTESTLKNTLVWSSAAFDSVTAVAFVNNQYVFAAFKDLATDSTYVYSMQSGSPVLRAAGEYYVTAMTAYGDSLLIAKKTSSNMQVYRGIYSNPFGVQVENMSSSYYILSLAGNTNYLYMVYDRKKLHFTNTSSNIDKDVLYYTRWWEIDN
ncbi:right-handed parallel beta-helix repeat-containing protein [bacterium]|nr:right-handed parallel beta-helix repeat-containing protein [bacterium]